MKRGSKVSVTGAKSFSGTVLVATAHILLIRTAVGATVLSRDCASMDPLQWRCAGLPVEVRTEGNMQAFRKRLQVVYQRARKL